MASHLSAANREAAEECFLRASACLRAGDNENAAKHLRRAQRMDPLCAKFTTLLNILDSAALSSKETKMAEKPDCKTTAADKPDVLPSDWTIEGGRLRSAMSSASIGINREEQAGGQSKNDAQGDGKGNDSIDHEQHDEDHVEQNEEDDGCDVIEDRLESSWHRQNVHDNNSNKDPLIDNNLDKMQANHQRCNTHTTSWHSTDNSPPSTVQTSNKTDDSRTTDDKTNERHCVVPDVEVENLGPRTPLMSQTPDVVKSCEPAMKLPFKTVRRVGGVRVKGRRRNGDSFNDGKQISRAVYNRSVSSESEETKSLETEGSRSDESKTDWTSRGEVTKVHLNVWLKKGYEVMLMILIYLAAILWTALLFTASGLKYLAQTLISFCKREGKILVIKIMVHLILFWHTRFKPCTERLRIKLSLLRKKIRRWWRRLGGKEEEPEDRFDEFENMAKALQTDPGETIDLPRTSDEAVERLLGCRNKDLYSILGVARNSTEEEIKKHYRKQAMLVHPDKNKSPGTEEAFKILGHAFETLGNEEKRREYDSRANEDQLQAEFEFFFTKLLEKMEESRNMLPCGQCGGSHRRYVITDRSIYNARYCGKCDIRHPVNDGDVWCESDRFGFRVYFYAYMDGEIYDITEWAACQGFRNRMKANGHAVTIRISSRGNNPPSRAKSQQEANERREVQDMLDRLFRDSQVYRSDHMPHPHGDRMGDMSGCSETYQSGKRAARARRRRKKKT